MIAFITGGTGLLGSHLVSLLAQEFDSVRMLVRRIPPSTISYPPNVDFIHGDLESEDTLREGMAGCAAVFHLAACVTRWERDESTYDRVNVAGFRRIMQLALESSIPRVIYTSTFFALGHSGDAPLTEMSRPLAGQWHTHYDRTKIAADSVIPEFRRRGLPLVRVFPSIIYGPGPVTQGNIVVRLIQDYLTGKMPGLLQGGCQVWSFAYVEDVARGHVLAYTQGTPGEDYVLGGDNRTLKEFFTLIAKRAGRKPLQRSIPIWAGLLTGAVEEALARAFGRPPNVTRGMIRAMEFDWACDSSKARHDLGYRYRPLERGLEQTLDWLKSQKLSGFVKLLH